MKKILFRALLALCLFALPACQSADKRVRGTAQQFLKAYYSADYAAAAALCTPAFAGRVSKGAEAQALVPEEIAQKTNSQIVSIVGKKLTLYKRSVNKPKIELP